MKRFLVCFLIAVLVSCVTGMAMADTIMPYANEYFMDASVSLSNSGMASFSATTSFIFSTLKISSCSLQEKRGESWVSVNTSKPSAVARNNDCYDVAKDYRTLCTSGKTYRIVATFDADGHTITRTSNERAF